MSDQRDPTTREVVLCTRGPVCHDDHHGWDCPMSDPLGDCLRGLMDELDNPILDQSRRHMLNRWIGGPGATT